MRITGAAFSLIFGGCVDVSKVKTTIVSSSGFGIPMRIERCSEMAAGKGAHWFAIHDNFCYPLQEQPRDRAFVDLANCNKACPDDDILKCGGEMGQGSLYYQRAVASGV
jgi:hypothetical protein